MVIHAVRDDECWQGLRPRRFGDVRVRSISRPTSLLGSGSEAGDARAPDGWSLQQQSVVPGAGRGTARVASKCRTKGPPLDSLALPATHQASRCRTRQHARLTGCLRLCAWSAGHDRAGRSHRQEPENPEGALAVRAPIQARDQGEPLAFGRLSHFREIGFGVPATASAAPPNIAVHRNAGGCGLPTPGPAMNRR
jgi:hypothetical protein